MTTFQKIRFQNVGVTIINTLIRAYQKILSPILGQRCRFHPSCSEYCKEAVAEYGPMYGLYLGVIRLLRCNPLFTGGIDPVPLKHQSLKKTRT